MDADYSKAGLMNFLSKAVGLGLLNANTARGWSAACMRILEGVADGDDVRKIDVPTAIKRYHNKHPGELKGNSLVEYQRRLSRAIVDFVKFTDDPTGYKGRGRGPSAEGGAKARPRVKPVMTTSALEASARGGALSALTTHTSALAPGTSLTLDFPIRADFLAQIVVPRDMKADEARRLSRFIMTLAMDFVPKDGE